MPDTSPLPRKQKDFGREIFPPHKDPANKETEIAELYPENLQDETNSYYNHNKVLPREAGVDYTGDADDYSDPNQQITLEKGQ